MDGHRLRSDAASIALQSDDRSVLTIRDVATILRCSKAHVCRVLNGKVAGVPRLAHLAIGRRKLVRRDWLEQWMEQSKRR